MTRAVGAEDLEAAAHSFAEDVAALSPQSVQGAKRALALLEKTLADARVTAPDQVAAIDELVGAAYRSDELQEGLAAMAERRPPRFGG